MIFDGAPAQAAQLAELLEGVLKRGGHLSGAPTCVSELIATARKIVDGPTADLPVVVVMLGGGTIVESYGTHPARVIFVDNDIEGLDRCQVTHVLGEDQYVTDGVIDVRPDRVEQVLEDLAADVPADEDREVRDTPLPR